MKKLLSKLIKSVFTAALVAMTFCTLSCASSKVGANESGKIDANNLIGSWFWNYGYDQEQFGNEQVTFNKDGTVYLFSIGPDWAEWDKGNWSIIDDSEQGPTLFFHLTEGKGLEDEWYPIDTKIYYSIQSITQNRILMSRYKRDLTGMGWIVQEFNPEVKQDYTRIKDGTKENLTGTWHFNKKCRPAGWNETWIFSEDDTIQVFTEEDGYKEDYKGTYKVEKSKNGTILHQTLTQISENNSAFRELNPPMEFWYDYKICNENLINVNCTKNNIGGEEHVYEPAIENFYYRDIPLETVTYHVDGFTFEDYYPVGTEYELIDQSRPYLVKGVPDHLCEQYLEGWYDNSAFSGNAVTKISASDTGNHEYWAKWSLNLHRSDWIDDNTKEQVHNHEFYLPISLLTPYMEFPESMENNFPSKGDTVYIVLTGKISDDYKAPWQLRIVDSSDGWFMIGGDWHYAEIEKGSFTHVFEVKMTENARTTDLSKIELNLCYWQDYCDEPRTISDFKFEILDGNSPKIIEHTLNYGNYIFKKKSVSGAIFTLPGNPDTLPGGDHWWMMQNNDFLGWYDNPDFKGKPVKSISGDENTKGKTFYGKYNLKFPPAEKQDNGEFFSANQIPLRAVIPNSKIKPKAGDIVKVAVSGTVSKDYEGLMGFDLVDVSDNGWNYLGGDWHYIETNNKKIKAFFEIKILNDAKFTSINDANFSFMYHPLKEGEQLIVSDYKIELVDEDPFVTSEAESKLISIKPCEEGLEFTIHKPASYIDFEGNLSIKYRPDNNYELEMWINPQQINENKNITVIWPFCKKGKKYTFECTWTDKNNVWHSQTIKALALAGKGELNYDALSRTEVFLESNTKAANLCIKNLTREKILDVLTDYLDIISDVQVRFPIISGKRDWSNTVWVFESGYNLYPNYDDNVSFYDDLFEKGKANILGDHNFWWGDKEKINEALSQHPEFWTFMWLNFRTEGHNDVFGFNLASKHTPETPYIPVLFD